MSTGIYISGINPISVVGGLFAQTVASTPVVNTTIETTIVNGGVGSLSNSISTEIFVLNKIY